MARVRSPARDEAKRLYMESNGEMKLVDIAVKLNILDTQVRKWKSLDKWEQELKGTLPNEKLKSKRNVTTKTNSINKDRKSKEDNSTKNNKTNTQNPKARYGNKNAKGNKGGPGGPVGNKHAETHGFFSKYLPEDTMELINEIHEKDPLDIIWENITIQYAAIIRAQKIMYVTDKNEMIKELKKSKVKSSNRETEKTNSNTSEEEYEYEFQFAWDRQATFLNAQSRAMATLQSMIKNYDEMLNKNWELATEEQKQRINKLKADIEKSTKDNQSDKPIEILIKRKGSD